MVTIGLIVGVLFLGGCARLIKPSDAERNPAQPLVVVVAPVLNLSNSSDWDPLQVTDIVASELQSFPNVVVIPVNRTLATLALMGKEAVETPQDALDLARELNADATLVTAITEYDPYDPPIVGVVMQWYRHPRRQPSGPGEPPGGFDPVSASRQASEVAPASAQSPALPVLQVQRVYNAAEEAVQDEVWSYGRHRGAADRPFGWRIYIKSQELFVRYCCWSTIRPMLLERETQQEAPKAAEAK